MKAFLFLPLWFFAFVMLVLMFVTGCTPLAEMDESMIASDEAEQSVTILIDGSGSFVDTMSKKAYDFIIDIVDKMFMTSVGSKNRVILAQLSANNRALLFQGTPQELRAKFPTSQAFKQWLGKTADPSGSLVHQALYQTTRYSLADPVTGKGKSAIFVMSDMIDTDPGGMQAKEKALTALSDYAKAGGVIGLYFVDQLICHEWHDHLKDAGFPPGHFRVYADIIDRPDLPVFD